VAALRVVPASRVAMDTSSLLIAFGPALTFKAPAAKLIISDEFDFRIKLKVVRWILKSLCLQCSLIIIIQEWWLRVKGN